MATGPSERAPTSYELATTHHPNPLVRFSHRFREGLGTRLASAYLPRGGAMLDFGAGEGALLRSVRQIRPDVEFAGVEPFSTWTDYRRFAWASDVTGAYDVITAFEVLEHMDDREDFFGLLPHALKPGGVAIVSVPNMLGPVIVPKALNAIRTNASWRYSPGEMLRAAVLLKGPPRGRGEHFLNHRGFDWRKVRERIRSGFEIVEERTAPFAALPWWLNSQWFCVFRRKAND